MAKASEHFNRSSVGAGAIGLLRHAVENNHMDVVKLLLGVGADVNRHDGGLEPAAEAVPLPEPEGATEVLQEDLRLPPPAKVRKRQRKV